MFDSLGNRMKEYENAYRLYLPKKLPVIIRIDGRAFHTFTKGFKRPFDEFFQGIMSLMTKELCEAVAGVKLAYTQSDEISLLLTNDDDINTEPWFNNNLQKLVSLSASIATLAFNKYYEAELYHDFKDDVKPYVSGIWCAQFDARAFVLPKEEVVNYFIWRQQDATRNSIQMVAQSLYSHKELLNKNTSEQQEMIFQKGQNWNDYPTRYKRGLCYLKRKIELQAGEETWLRNQWVADLDIPIFTQDRSYIENTFTKKEG